MGLNERNQYVFENDTLKITYDLWAEKGQLSFHIYNKLNVPVYIDWKRSSFVQNSEKLSYWIDKSVSKGITLYRYNWARGSARTMETTTKMERITFIAPQSNIDRNSFVLLINQISMPKDSKIENLEGKKAKYLLFSQERSPLIFRNFLTFSFTEDGGNSFYVDNGFYVDKVLETSSTNVFKNFGDDNPQYVKAKIYDPRWFYVNL